MDIMPLKKMTVRCPVGVSGDSHDPVHYVRPKLTFRQCFVNCHAKVKTKSREVSFYISFLHP